MRFLWTAAICWLWSLAAPAAPVSHYVTFYGYNGVPDGPTLSHTFAAFVERDDQTGVLKTDTISWIPADRAPVHLLSVQPGHNYTLAETFTIAGDRVSISHGPYRITDAVYAKAMARIAFLKDANVHYKMFPWHLRGPALNNQPGGAVNCVAAVSDIMGFLDPGEVWGDPATQQVIEFFARQGAFVDYPAVHPEGAPSSP
jgi:hypothetical protein